MTIHYGTRGSRYTAWLERRGVRTFEGEGKSLAESVFNLIALLANRDDPDARPRLRLVEDR